MNATTTFFLSGVKTDLLQLVEENTLVAYMGSLGIILFGCLLLVLLKKIAAAVVRRPFIANNHRIKQKLVSEAQQRLFSFLFILPFYWGVSLLNFPAGLERTVDLLFLCLFLIKGIKLMASAIALLVDFWLRGGRSNMDPSAGKAIMPIARIILWALAITFLLDNLGFKISTIIAGLGIMGVAVGLAGQAILSDFFSHLVILIDKPFRIGDFVQLASNGLSGTVERIGLKTTRLRSPTGEKIICSNNELTKGLISNFNDVKVRRVRLLFPLAFGLSSEKIEAVPTKIREILGGYPKSDLVRAVLVDFSVWAMNFELVYKLSIPDLAEATRTQHEINIKILEYFEEEGIAFSSASPSAAVPLPK